MSDRQISDTAENAAPAEPPRGRRERRKEALRNHIFDVATRLFTEHGFESTTVEQIATAADIAPATFFNHFQNKQAVLIEMTNLVVSYLQGLLDQEFERETDTRSRLMGFATSAALDIEQARGIARDVVLTMVKNESQPGEAPYLVRVHQPFVTMLREGQERGEVRDDLSAEFLAEMVVGLLNATVTSWLSDSNYPIEKHLPKAAQYAWESVQVRAQSTV
jgi:AcrR family transcriptional regulator